MVRISLSLTTSSSTYNFSGPYDSLYWPFLFFGEFNADDVLARRGRSTADALLRGMPRKLYL
jgi:hypothetical protein